LRDDFEPPEPIKAVIPMDGVVYGSFFLPIEVLSKDDAGEHSEEEGEPPGEIPAGAKGQILEFKMEGAPKG